MAMVTLLSEVFFRGTYSMMCIVGFTVRHSALLVCDAAKRGIHVSYIAMMDHTLVCLVVYQGNIIGYDELHMD
jgi:hypothetical protein